MAWKRRTALERIPVCAAFAALRTRLYPTKSIGLEPKPHDFVVRSEGLEPPRFYSLPPQGSASTNSATSAWDTGWKDCGLPDQRRRCNKSGMEGQGGFATELTT